MNALPPSTTTTTTKQRKFKEMDKKALEQDLNTGVVLYEKIPQRNIITRSIAAKTKQKTSSLSSS
jgi:hypothetical protein